jgi:uncharacterized membrane protein YiaA
VVDGVGMDEYSGHRVPEDDPGSGSWLLVVAGGSLVVAAGCFLLASFAGNLTGYLLAAIVPGSLVALFRRQSQRRLASVGVAITRSRSWVSTALVVVGMLMATLHAWAIARALV